MGLQMLTSWQFSLRFIKQSTGFASRIFFSDCPKAFTMKISSKTWLAALLEIREAGVREMKSSMQLEETT
jgi:hypothetical protein